MITDINTMRNYMATNKTSLVEPPKFHPDTVTCDQNKITHFQM